MKHVNAALLVALAISGVSSNDLQFGTDNGRIVFNETIQASPAIWRQVQKITVNVSDHEVISNVKVTDNRPEKDGEAQIVEGGEGQKNVTVELKSPTVFRGFDFHVIVYAVQDNVQHPAVMTKDFDINSSAKPDNQDSAFESVTEDIETNEKDIPVAPETTNPKDNTPAVPVLTGEQPRLYRNTQEQTSDPIVQYVTEKNVEDDLKLTIPDQKVTSLMPEVNTDDKINESVKPLSITPLLKEGDYATDKTTEGLKSYQMNGDKMFSTTSEAADMTFTTEKTHEKMVMPNFDSISRELGQKVVFGIKKH